MFRIPVILVVGLLAVGLAADAPARDEAGAIRAVPAKEADAPRRAPASPKLATPAKAVRSAACCSKKGGKPCQGKSRCGVDCKVADKMSQCVGARYSFECPAGKGLTCFNGVCSCE